MSEIIKTTEELAVNKAGAESNAEESNRTIVIDGGTASTFGIGATECGQCNDEVMEENDSAKASESETKADNAEHESDNGVVDTEQMTIYEMLEAEIMKSDLPLKEKNKRLSKLIRMREKQVNILLVGATGSGKSSTVNALFNMEVAKVGVGVDPETDTITSYTLSNLVIWDTPGLGDSVENDERYNLMLTKKLCETDDNGKMVIDLVLVVLDSSTKDLRTTIDLIKDTIIPSLGDDAAGRILVGLNQADIAMKGKHWNSETNEPDEVLSDFLEKKAESVRERINKSTELNIEPVYYCAGYTEENGEQCKPYNLAKLLYYIIKSIPSEKRLGIVDNINKDKEVWIHNDDHIQYTREIKKTFWDTVSDYIEETADTAGLIGESILGVPGKLVGYLIGGLFGLGKGIYYGIME